MSRPRIERRSEGLTRTEVAAQLRCSTSNVRRLQREGLLPQRKDRDGIYRFHPYEVAEVARKLGRVVQTDGERVARLYAYFIAPGFKLTRQTLANIVVETREHPDVVLACWEKFQAGPGTDASDAEAREMERLSREYDEQIAAMDQDLARRRRAAFIPTDDPSARPPSSR
jgi:hypothetical protein